jgi:hypothetical protein
LKRGGQAAVTPRDAGAEVTDDGVKLTGKRK